MKKNTPNYFTLSLFDDGQVCKSCLQWKHFTEYDAHGAWNRPKKNCRECTAIGAAKMCAHRHYRQNRELYAHRASLSNYGVTAEWFNAHLKKQNGVCAICKQSETALSKLGNPKPLSVDHCHITGKPRGLLCTRCNIGIGGFRDDAGIIIRAMQYLLDSNE